MEGCLLCLNPRRNSNKVTSPRCGAPAKAKETKVKPTLAVDKVLMRQMREA